MVNKPLIGPYFWGGYVRGGRLTSHDNWLIMYNSREAFEVVEWICRSGILLPIQGDLGSND